MMTYLRILKDAIPAIINLVYPKLCVACEETTPMVGSIICLTCRLEIPFTDQFKIKNNALEMRFLGRIPFQRAAALFQFRGGGMVEKMIHKLKYANRPEIGIALGKQWGKYAEKSGEFSDVDYIIPIPLHKKKKAYRGYNQTAMISKGIAEILDIQVLENIIIKYKEHTSQTHKGRIDRLENVMDTFIIKNEKKIENKHILIVDDVITTGATMEAAANKLKNIKGVKLSLGFLAMKLLE